MGRLYVRTPHGGTDPAVEVEDLGFTVPTGSSWTELSASASGIPLEGMGQFTAIDLKDSRDLYDTITTSGLEWSTNGSALASPEDFSANYMLIQDLYDDLQDFIQVGDVTTPKILLVDEIDDYTYVGEAEPGTLASEASWRIYRLDESGSGDEELIKLYANGSINFDQVWETRSGLDYS